MSRGLAGGLSFGAVLLYVLAYALGAGPVPWVYLPEVLPKDKPNNPLCTCMLGCRLSWCCQQQGLCI